MNDGDTRIDIIPRTDQRPAPYPNDVRNLAFVCYVEARGNADRTLRLMRARCAQSDADDDMPLPDELPTASTIRRWAHAGHWDIKRREAVALHYPEISLKQAARVVEQTDSAQDEYDAIMAGERDHLTAAQLNARVALIGLNFGIRGLGTAGAKGGEVKLQPDRKPADALPITPAERAQRQRDRIEQARERQR